MKTKAYTKYFLIILICSIFGNKSLWAQANRAELTGAYIYNFAKLSSTPQLVSNSGYTILLISEKKELIDEFNKMQKSQKINDKKIILQTTGKLTNPIPQADLIFVSSDKSELYPNIFAQTQNTNTLLVSENYADKRKILLNLYDTKEGKLLFEINKSNIYQRQIRIDDEILLMGGTEIDLVQLYLESQTKLNNLEKKLAESREILAASQKNLETLNSEIKESQTLATNYKTEAVTQKNVLEKQKKLLEKQISERNHLIINLKKYKIQIKEQQKAYAEREKRMQVFLDSLATTRIVLNSFKDEINMGNAILQDQKAQIEKQNSEIEAKQKDIENQGQVITRQRYLVGFFLIVFIVVSVLVLLLTKNVREKKAKNKLLEISKKEISEKNNALHNSNEEIRSINEELHDRNEELNSSLDEIKHMQQQLVHAEKMASLGVLSAGIAHEINNPINFVYAGINSLLRDFKDIEPVINEINNINIETDNLKDKLKIIQKLKEENYFDEAFEAIPEIIGDIKLGADRTAEIVKGLRSFSRVDKGELQMLDIHQALDTALILLKNNYKNNVEIIKDYAEKLPEIPCYPGKINQAFLNILANAIDAIEERGEIFIETKSTNKNIHISIKDTGTGIPESIKHKLFDPFFTTKPVGKGTGLGLSITFGIIDEHGGTIKIKSEEGKGSEFIILLPLENNLYENKI